MNTLEISKLTGKSHNNVKRDVRKSVPDINRVIKMISRSEFGKEIEVYELSANQIDYLKYSNLIIAVKSSDMGNQNDYPELEQRVKELENEIGGLNDTIKDKDNTIKDKNEEIDKLENTIIRMKSEMTSFDSEKAKLAMEKDKINQKTKDYNVLIEKYNVAIKTAPRHVKTILEAIRKNKSNLPEMSLQDLKTARQSFHPDKTKRDTDKLFAYFQNKIDIFPQP